MKYVIIGGVAAGTKAAAKLKRCDRSAVVKIFTKGTDISYAGCGLPYYIGGDIPSRDKPIVHKPAEKTRPARAGGGNRSEGGGGGG